MVDVLSVMLVNSAGMDAKLLLIDQHLAPVEISEPPQKKPTLHETSMTWHLKMDGCEDKPFLLLFSGAFTLESFRECIFKKKR